MLSPIPAVCVWRRVGSVCCVAGVCACARVCVGQRVRQCVCDGVCVCVCLCGSVTVCGAACVALCVHASMGCIWLVLAVLHFRATLCVVYVAACARVYVGQRVRQCVCMWGSVWMCEGQRV